MKQRYIRDQLSRGHHLHGQRPVHPKKTQKLQELEKCCLPKLPGLKCLQRKLLFRPGLLFRLMLPMCRCFLYRLSHKTTLQWFLEPDCPPNPTEQGNLSVPDPCLQYPTVPVPLRLSLPAAELLLSYQSAAGRKRLLRSVTQLFPAVLMPWPSPAAVLKCRLQQNRWNQGSPRGPYQLKRYPCPLRLQSSPALLRFAAEAQSEAERPS